MRNRETPACSTRWLFQAVDRALRDPNRQVDRHPLCVKTGRSEQRGRPPPPVLTTLEVTPATATLFTVAPGNAVTLSVVAKDQDGQAMSGLGSPSFSSDNGTIASVRDNGTITAHHYGDGSSCAGKRSGGHTGDRIPAGDRGRAGGRHGELDVWIHPPRRHVHNRRSAG